MNGLLIRRRQRADGPSHGVLSGAGISCHTLELPWRENATGISCIPPGHYLVHPHISPSQGKCLLVSGTEPRTFILIHAGNTCRDTRGCILVGERRGFLRIQDADLEAVLISRIALRKVLAAVTEPMGLLIEAC